MVRSSVDCGSGEEGPKALFDVMACDDHGPMAVAAVSNLEDVEQPFEAAESAATVLTTHLGVKEHDVALILGSGWAAAADGIGEVVAEVELSSVPGFPPPRVKGHRDVARSVRVGEINALVLGGRVHLYEGFSASQVVHGVRTARACGCSTLIVTNAAGAIDPNFPVGRPVLISDQLNLTGTSPMAGPAPPAGYPNRFCDMTDAYSPRLRAIARAIDPQLSEGTYAGMFGGAYETPAEVQMVAGLGADLVGMSTVLEVIAARHLDMEVLGLSLVTNAAAGIGQDTLAHDDVLRTAAAATDSIVGLIAGILQELNELAGGLRRG